ncbi:MAG: molybdopterin molybdotransferase MoeA [Flavobacteriaceae bacterium]|nr:molybdopterin molybdotransferase MoeA [Flavobacteriaceae bacterium]
MISSQQALKLILKNTEDFGIEEIPFLESVGRVLKEDILADRDFPPFDRVSMDGIAIVFDTFTAGNRTFKIENVQAAGSKQLELNNKSNCIEVMTGAVLPINTDVVIPYEQVTIANGKAIIEIDKINQLQNIHKQGNDRKKTDILIKKNRVISPSEIGIFATIGKSTVKVAKQPKALIISTGDELVAVNENPLPYQIRRSNVYSMLSLLEELKIHAETAHITDDKPLLKEKIARYLEQYDVLLFSGAVSKGKYDFLPEVLDELGVKKLFHKVKQRPGKPFWFGKKGSKSVFAFPGNPVSTYVGCLKYFYPWYKKLVGIQYENQESAILSEDFFFKPELTYFLQVKTKNEKGRLYAIPVVGHGSGDLANLADADAFLELPDDKSNFAKGEVFPLIRYR